VGGQPELDFAGLLRLLRERADLTQEELAEAAGLSLRGVSDLERGFHRTARKDTAVLLAGALGLEGPARELFVAAARGRAPAAGVLAAARGGRRLVAGSPYRGLAAFEEQDAGLFFGRETATAQVLDRMSQHVQGTGLLVVSGASGAGKSSLLRAGVLPQIRSAGLAAAAGAGSWGCVLLTPTHAPLDELALRAALLSGADAAAVRRGLDTAPEGFALTARQAALAAPPAPAGDPAGLAGERDRPQWLLLVVDQFEELFTQCADEGQRRAFIAALHAAGSARQGPEQAPAALVVLGVRADFEARCAVYPQLAGPIQDRYLVTPMTDRQLRLAITQPAKKAGSKVEDDLVEVLLAEARTHQPGATGAGVLPLLSHALDQAWRSRAGNSVTLADYERTGGIEGAVAASAQRAYDTLTPTQKDAARQVFTRLTAISSDGLDSADRATRAALTEGKTAVQAHDVEQVLEAFTAERLLTLAAGTVEISHEILLTAWPLLRDTWLADTHADRITRTRLRATAADWDHHHRDPAYLYTGTLLQTATGTATRITADPAHHPPLSHTETDFLHASDHAHRRRARRRQAVIAGLLALVIGFASVAALAIQASQQAAHQRDIALSGQLISQSQLVGDTNPVIAKLLSVAAWRLNPSNAARYAMLAAAALPGIRVLAGRATRVSSVAFSPHGQMLATGTDHGRVQLWDVATGRQVGRSLSGPPSDIESMAFSPGGQILAGNEGGQVQLWDAASRRRIGSPLRCAGPIESMAFTPDGKTLATATYDGTVQWWDVATPAHQQMGKPLITETKAEVNSEFPVSPPLPVSVAFSLGGQVLATSIFSQGTVQLWDVAHRHKLGPPVTAVADPLGASGKLHQVDSVAVSPDGKILATGSADGTVQLWGVAPHLYHKLGGPLPGYGGPVRSVAFSPDGKTLATGSAYGTAQLWDVATGQQIGGPLTGHTGAVQSVAFSPDGQTLATGSADGTARLWHMATSRPIHAGRSDIDSVDSVAFSPASNILATGTETGAVQLWAAATHVKIATLTSDEGPLASVAFSPHGQTLAIGYGDGQAQLWDVAPHHYHKIGGPLPGYSGPVRSVAFSPDGQTLAIGYGDGQAQLWDVAPHHYHEIGGPLSGHGGSVTSVAFSPHGQTLAIANGSTTVRLWDVRTQQQIRSLTSHGEAVDLVAFGLGGHTLATASYGATVRLWHIATHQIATPLTGGTGQTYQAAAFSPDGKTLATASGNGNDTVRLWDLTTGQQIAILPAGDTSPPTSVAFSPDGKTLAVGSDDGTVHLWNVGYLMDVMPNLCASAGRSLTPIEWARYTSQSLPYQQVCP
jgi:WD40 repeat protein/transcriptional regulator with XRE-family HTH domain